MSVTIDKRLAIKCLCVSRQAERSIAFAIGSEKQWARLREYYDEIRMRPLLEAIDELDSLIGRRSRTWSSEAVYPNLLAAGVTYPLKWLFNRLRNRWRFRSSEAEFLRDALVRFTEALHEVNKPEAPLLVNLRMDLSVGQTVIHNHLVGVADADKAMKVEHFCQPYHIRHVTIDEVCGPSALVSA